MNKNIRQKLIISKHQSPAQKSRITDSFFLIILLAGLPVLNISLPSTIFTWKMLSLTSVLPFYRKGYTIDYTAVTSQS